MRSAAAAKHNEKNDGADDGDEERTETTEAIRKEGEHAFELRGRVIHRSCKFSHRVVEREAS